MSTCLRERTLCDPIRIYAKYQWNAATSLCPQNLSSKHVLVLSCSRADFLFSFVGCDCLLVFNQASSQENTRPETISTTNVIESSQQRIVLKNYQERKTLLVIIPFPALRHILLSFPPTTNLVPRGIDRTLGLTVWCNDLPVWHSSLTSTRRSA